MPTRLLPVLAVVALLAGCATSRTQANQHHSRAPARGTVITYPEQGVTIGPRSARAARYAAASSLKTPAAAIAALRLSPAAQVAFRTTVPVASLRTVTERLPVVTGVRTGVPYQAWVVSVRGPVVFIGGPGSTPPPAGTKCTDVEIYDLQLSRWTESFQSC